MGHDAKVQRITELLRRIDEDKLAADARGGAGIEEEGGEEDDDGEEEEDGVDEAPLRVEDSVTMRCDELKEEATYLTPTNLRRFAFVY